MKTIKVCLHGYIGSTAVVKVVLDTFSGPTAAYEAHRLQEIMQSSDDRRITRLKAGLDKFYGMKLVYLVKKEDGIL